MKKTNPGIETPVNLGQAFGEAPELPAIKIEDDPSVPLDHEIAAYYLFRDVAGLYCTIPGRIKQDRPETYFEQDDTEGPYYITIMYFRHGDKPSELDEHGKEVPALDPDIYDAVKGFMGDLALCAPNGTDFSREPYCEVVGCRTVDDMIATSLAVLNSEDCPGSMFDKANYRSRLHRLAADIARDRLAANPPPEPQAPYLQ